MKFSLFLNSRERPQHLINLLNSIVAKTYDGNNIEILIKLDKGDDTTIGEFIDYLDGWSMCDVRLFISEQPDNLNVSLNHLASETSGDYLFVLNDDVTFLTQDWDKVILDQLPDNLHENIWYLGVPDTSIDKARHQGYASFPILSRVAYESLGYFVTESFFSLGADVHLFRIFEAIGRVRNLDEVLLDHTLHNTLEKVLNPDKTAIKLRKLIPTSDWTKDIGEEVSKLNEKIASGL